MNNIEPKTVTGSVVDFFAAVFCGKIFIIVTIIAIYLASTIYTNSGALDQLDAQYHYTTKDQVIRFNAIGCDMIIDYDTAKFKSYVSQQDRDCSAYFSNMQGYIATHDHDVSGINRGINFWLWPVSFFLVYVMVFVTSDATELLYARNRVFYKFLISWSVFALLILTPLTFGNANLISSQLNDTRPMGSIYLRDGYVTDNGKWISLPRGSFSKLMNGVPIDTVKTLEHEE